jgi:hypothetical protein
VLEAVGYLHNNNVVHRGKAFEPQIMMSF